MRELIGPEIELIAGESGLLVISHGAHELQVHLLAAVPNAAYPGVHGFWLERSMTKALELNNGVAIAPDRPAWHRVRLGRPRCPPSRLGKSQLSRLSRERAGYIQAVESTCLALAALFRHGITFCKRCRCAVIINGIT